LSVKEFELQALFVEPMRIGQGVGRALMDHAKVFAANVGAHSLVIEGDPHAERFYRAAGGRLIGQRESNSIPRPVLAGILYFVEGR
jgi:GNAT superfamily N-acetyltransferase